MRTAHIITVDAGGKAKLVARGLFSEVRSKFQSLDLGAGEVAELHSRGVFKTLHGKAVKKKD